MLRKIGINDHTRGNLWLLGKMGAIVISTSLTKRLKNRKERQNEQEFDSTLGTWFSGRRGDYIYCISRDRIFSCDGRCSRSCYLGGHIVLW